MAGQSGEIRVADNVVAVVAGVAVEDVSDVTIRSSGLYQEWAKKVNGGTKGIDVSILDGRVTIDMRVSVRYGAPIHQVCKEVQEKVKDNVEDITGLAVEAINVRVEAIEIK
jgi:uncharacterized alkaline shock family protein YloU